MSGIVAFFVSTASKDAVMRQKSDPAKLHAGRFEGERGVKRADEMSRKP